MQVMRQMLEDRDNQISDLKAQLDERNAEFDNTASMLKDKKAHAVLQHWIIKYMLLKDKKNGGKGIVNERGLLKLPGPIGDEESIFEAISQICPSAFEGKSPTI